jgi:FKBP-type peptidyl-prolyl cis-trans isomerase FkpA
MIELEIPPVLGYGAQGNPPSIPPDTTLFFRVEMIEVK